MEFLANVSPTDLADLKLIGESNQFAIYASGQETYLLVQRHAAMPWVGLRLSGDALFRISGLLGAATRDVYHDVAAHLSPAHREPSLETGSGAPNGGRATESRTLYEDDLTEERQISPVQRDIVASTLVLDPADGNEHVGEPLTGPRPGPA